MHISDQVIAELTATGWATSDGVSFSKTIEGFAEAGQFSDGRRVVNLCVDEGGRWFERKDGWGVVELDIDLREFDDAKSAIAAVLA